ncbi:MAG: hypothetical protein QXL15_01020 [Candidatus Korarchaeota archaeon]
MSLPASTEDDLKQRMETLQKIYKNLVINEINFPPLTALLVLDQTLACGRLINFAEKLHKNFNTEIYTIDIEPGSVPLQAIAAILEQVNVDMIILPPTIEGVNKIAQKHGIACMIIPYKIKEQ